MDNEENEDAGNSVANENVLEPIEVSVIVGDDEMIIVQADDLNQVEGGDASTNDNNAPPNVEENIPIVDEDEVVTPGRKKRKRSLARKSMTQKKAQDAYNEEDDDGSTCSICLDTWECKGAHRLVSLKCGHLFGDSCIRRWIQECANNTKCCPTCKQKALVKDIRALFAKKLVAIDKSEEYRLQNLIDAEKTKNVDLQNTLSVLRVELAIAKAKCENLESKLNGTYSELPSQSTSFREISYRMSLDKNIEINREPGCRAMVYGRRTQLLIVSQKSTQTLFPGYGVRFMNAHNFQFANNFLHMSTKQIRDLSLDSDEELLVSASMDKSVKMFSVPNRCPICVFTPAESPIWTVTFDKTRTKHLYLGSQGSTYLYDIRNPQNYVEQLSTLGDMSPVISICSVPITNDLPFGGIVVCKLQSLWFYEYSSSQQIIPTKLIVDGPFVSVNYDEYSNLLLVATRPNSKYLQSRYIVGTLIKVDQLIILNSISTIFGSKSERVMIRSAQVKMGADNLLAAYLQDTNVLTTWNSKSGTKMQAINMSDVIFDLCPLYVNNRTFLAALSETRCRIFQINAVTK